MIPESTNKLSDISIIDDTFIVNYLADAQSLVELHGIDGVFLERLELPAIGTAHGLVDCARTPRRSTSSRTSLCRV